jgi:hypothetical protein
VVSGSEPLQKMKLTADAIRFQKQTPKDEVEVFGCTKLEVVNVVVRRDELGAVEARQVDRTLEPQGTLEMGATHGGPGEARPCLKDDTRLLGVGVDRPERAHERRECSEKGAHGRRLALEMIGDAIPSTRMPHVARHVPVSAFRAAPEGSKGRP